MSKFGQGVQVRAGCPSLGRVSEVRAGCPCLGRVSEVRAGCPSLGRVFKLGQGVQVWASYPTEHSPMNQIKSSFYTMILKNNILGFTQCIPAGQFGHFPGGWGAKYLI